MKLIKHAERLGVARLGPGADLPKWAGSGTILGITATAAETTVLCTYADIPKRAQHAGPFTAYEIEGPLDLAMTGVLHELLGPLAEAEVSVFVLSTFDTDWILVPQPKESTAEEAWRRSGHTVVVPSAQTGSPQ